MTPIETPYGCFYGPDQDPITQQLRAYGAHCRPILELLLRVAPHDKTVVDVGAHIGTVTVPLARAGHRVIAFEPYGAAREYLTENVRLNGLEEMVEIRAEGVTADGKPRGLLIARNLGETSLTAGNAIQTVRLDDALPSDGIGLLKIDVEGCEMDVLRSAQERIASNHPLMLIEACASRLLSYGSSLGEVERFLRDCSYQLFTPLGSRNVASDKVRLAALPSIRWIEGRVTDVLAVPASAAAPQHSRMGWLQLAPRSLAKRYVGDVLRRCGLR